MFKRKEKDTTGDPVGGIALYLSIIAFTLIAISNSWVVISLFSIESLPRWIYFAIGILLGFAIQSLVMRGEFAVLLHEFKHLFLASVVGNKVKKLKVGDLTGHVQYSYTKKTAHYNAMIALAPYWLPIFTVPACISLFTPYGRQDPMLMVIGLCYGIDLLSGCRDIGRHQTDITLIRGGYFFGIWYLVAAHLTVFTLLAAWVSAELPGLKAIALGMIELLQVVANYYFAN